MSFTFPCDAQQIIRERRSQFVNLGIPVSVLERVRHRVIDMWRDAPGGWAFEWSEEAKKAERSGDDLGASLLYGVARFPCFANTAHRTAYKHQLGAYLRAMDNSDEEFFFKRKILTIPYRRTTTPVAVHLLSAGEPSPENPLLLFMGGVDTWKMDVHHVALTLSRLVGATVAMIDMPGTGESQVALASDADVIVRGVLASLRTEGQRVGFLAFSYSGLWSAKLALLGAVDAAVAIGAPLDATFTCRDIRQMPNGMDGIIGNAMGFAECPSPSELFPLLEPFSLRWQGLLDAWVSDTPLYVLNGDHDPYVFENDLTVFDDRPSTKVRIVRGAAYCALDQMQGLVLELGLWLRKNLSDSVRRPPMVVGDYLHVAV